MSATALELDAESTSNAPIATMKALVYRPSDSGPGKASWEDKPYPVI
jgi:hypothetical protein